MSNPAVRPRVMTRAMAVERLRARLLLEGFPRIQMFILVSLTGLAGFGASVAMLGAGLETMALRYLLAMGVAYVVFLLLLFVWLHTSAADYADMAFPNGGGSGGDGGGTDFAGGGGSFDGGGASGNVDFGSEHSAGSGIDAVIEKPFEVVAQAEEGAIPLAVILLALGIALSSLFVIWSAPILFAEILVDALLAAGLYRRLRLIDPRHWMGSAVRRTILPFVLTTLAVTGAGWGMQAWEPEARSLGEVIAGR